MKLNVALLPVKLAVESLCEANASLLSADVSINFMLDELSNQNTTLGANLKLQLLHQLAERRTSYSDVLQYLHDASVSQNKKRDFSDCTIFNKLNKTEICREIESIIDRFRVAMGELTGSSEDESEPEEIIEPVNLTMKKRLQVALKKTTATKSNITDVLKLNKSKNLKKLLKREMILFKEEQRRGELLDLAYNYLLSIKPTSVESERAFSAAGQLCTKIRSRAYFINQQKDR